MKKQNLFILSFFFYQYIYFNNYAIFIPNNEETNVYNIKTQAFSEKMANEYLSTLLDYPEWNKSLHIYTKPCAISIDTDKYYFYQENGHDDFGRRALFKNIKNYKKVFCFENKAKFESYSDYKFFIDTSNEYKREYKMLKDEYFNVLRWPKIFKISSASNLKELESRYHYYQKNFTITTEIEFHSLGIRYVFFTFKDSKKKYYKKIKAGLFDFSSSSSFDIEGANLLVLYCLRYYNPKVEEMDDIEVNELQVLTGKDPDCGQSVDFYFYQEGGGYIYGFSRLFDDIKKMPYKFKIILPEDERVKFNKKFPQSFIETFEFI